MKYIVGVSKTYSNRGKHRHRPDTKRRWHIYGYDFDENGQLYYHTKPINPIQVPYFKSKVVKKIQVICVHCEQESLVFAKNISKVAKTECSNGCPQPSLVTRGQLMDIVNDA